MQCSPQFADKMLAGLRQHECEGGGFGQREDKADAVEAACAQRDASADCILVCECQRGQHAIGGTDWTKKTSVSTRMAMQPRPTKMRTHAGTISAVALGYP